MVPSPDTQPSWKEAMAATFDEAAESFTDEGSAQDADSEGDETADTAVEAEGEDDADTDGAPEDGSDDDAGDDGSESDEWNGSPDTIPDTLKPAFAKAVEEAVGKRQEEMTKGVQKYLQKVADERQTLQLQMQQVSLMQQQLASQVKPQSQNLGPQRPGEDADAQDWDRYYDDRATWVADQRFDARMRQAMESGQLPDPNRMAQMSAQVEQRERLTFVANLPGCTDKTMLKMADLAKADPKLHALMDDNDGARTLFNIAKAQEEAELKAAGIGKKAEEQARRGAQAGKNGVPRPGGVRKSVEKADLPKDMQFRNPREKIEYLLRQD